ncbi:dTDP-4-dehydrorhamnose 3,5-epimerase [Aquimarina gracilis]|uniref:dTDP-4-dehydrorhamnose 3,5-epimerase n=1 Tax=Aquimarina gracilis TaxID=874422 RepID=A0ABU6A0T6_9FLAO|nr:dTDP-4-dehydrorhamnose 3,5-epimerase [Aquimarina gracilis]MEB3347753.1 dTDP-4-dehydrorhamnose 3,5-epimerase [Aquimarina gracilis]
MNIESTFLEGCFIIKPRIIEDNRGYFFESFNQKEFQEKIGFEVDFVQDNQSFSHRGILRGLHFQKGSFAQAKLVRVVRGEVLDVVVDLRPNSKTFKKHFSILLNDQNNFQLYIPRGFAHGFVTLSDYSIFSYKCDNYYNKSSESGIRYNDTDLAIDWKLNDSEIKLSAKDNMLPFLKDLINEQ